MTGFSSAELVVRLDARGVVLGQSRLGACRLTDPTRTNVVANPLLLTDGAGWSSGVSGVSGYQSRVTDGTCPVSGYAWQFTASSASASGLAGLQYENPGTPTYAAGAYAWSVWVWSSAASTLNVAVRQWMGSTWLATYTPVSVAASTWTRVTGTTTVPVGAPRRLALDVFRTGAWTIGQSLRASGLVVETAPRWWADRASITDAGPWVGTISDTVAWTGDLLNVTGDLLEVDVTASMSVAGADLLPEVSEASIRTRVDAADFVGLPLTIDVRGCETFSGVVSDVAWTTEVAPLDPRAAGGLKTTWTVTASGLELLRLNAPVVASRTARTPGVLAGAAGALATPWGASAWQQTLADFVRDVSGQESPDPFLGVPPNADLLLSPAAWHDVLGGRPLGVYWGVNQLFRNWPVDDLDDIDAGTTQRDRLLSVAHLVGGRVTADAEVVARDDVSAEIPWSTAWVRRALSGQVDQSAPQGVRVTSGTAVVLTSRGPLRWVDLTFDADTVPISAGSVWPNPLVGTTDPEAPLMRRLGVAAARTPLPPLAPRRTITSLTADPLALEASAPAGLWGAPLPWRVTGDETGTVVGVRHTCRPDDPVTGRSGWSVELTLAPAYLTDSGNDLWPAQPIVTDAAALLPVGGGVADGVRVTVQVQPGALVRALGGPGVTDPLNLAVSNVDNVNVFLVEAIADASGLATLALKVGNPGPTGWALFAVDPASRRQSPPTEIRVGLP